MAEPFVGRAEELETLGDLARRVAEEERPGAASAAQGRGERSAGRGVHAGPPGGSTPDFFVRHFSR